MWFGLLVALGCGTSAPEAAPAVQTGGPPVPGAPATAPGQVDIATFHGKHAAGEVSLLLDVRSPGEFAAGHVPGAVNLPLDQLAARIAEVKPPEGQPVYVICEVGGRSARAAADLAGRGVQVVDVAGGTRAWKAAGHPVE